jgi:hypothetical protein
MCLCGKGSSCRVEWSGLQEATMKLLRGVVYAAFPVGFAGIMLAQDATVTRVAPAPVVPRGSLPLPAPTELRDRLLGVSPGFLPLIPSDVGGLAGAPYSLLKMTTVTRTLANGTTVKSERMERQMRDSEGRARTEHYVERDGDEVLTFVSISAAVDGESMLLNPRMKRADVYHFPERKPPTAEEEAARTARMEAMRATIEAARSKASGLSAIVVRPIYGPAGEPLGQRNIAGVLAEGTRITQVIPVGKMGNDRELKVVTDTWISPDVHVEMERTVDDPINGKSEMVVTSLDRGEPDARLFKVPDGYKVEDRSKHVE